MFLTLCSWEPTTYCLLAWGKEGQCFLDPHFSPRKIYPQKSLCVFYCLRSTTWNRVCLAGLGLEKVGTGVSFRSPPWLQQSAILGSKSLCIRKDALVRQRELGVTVAMVTDFAETIASWMSRRKGLGKWVAGDPGVADMRTSMCFCFCFVFFFSFPPLGFHGGRRLEEAASSTFYFLELQSSWMLASQYSTLHSTVEFESGKGMGVPFFLSLSSLRHSVHWQPTHGTRF